MVSPWSPDPNPDRNRRPNLGEGIIGISQRIPPANLSAEQALLGALLANNKAFDRVADFLLPEHFADAIHARVFEAIRTRINAGRIADVVTLRAEFENAGTLDEVGGAEYLVQLLTAMVGIINAAEYGQVIYDCWLRRQMIDIGEVLVNRAFGVEQGEAREQAVGAAGALLDLAQQKTDRAVALGDLCDTVLAQTEAAMAAGGRPTTGVPTGVPDLDDMLGMLQPSQFIVVAGRPGMGKTVEAQCIATAAAKAGHPVAWFSLEMGGEELGERLLSAEARIPGDRLRRGRISQKEMDALVAARQALGALPLHIDDTAGLTVEEIRLRCRALSRKQPLGLVVIDYLGLVRPPREIARQGMTAGLEHVSNRLKELAKELRCPVVALHQLNRGVEGRDDKRPALSDLRWSGAIEQDADVVMFLYREEYYLRLGPQQRPDEPDAKFYDRQKQYEDAVERCRGKIEQIIAKQRRGPTLSVMARFDGATSRIWQEPEDRRAAEP